VVRQSSAFVFQDQTFGCAGWFRLRVAPGCRSIAEVNYLHLGGLDQWVMICCESLI
jgi:hypothetical protein